MYSILSLSEIFIRFAFSLILHPATGWLFHYYNSYFYERRFFFLVLLFFFLSLSSDSSLLIRDKNFVRCSYFVVMCVLHPILMAMMLLHFNGLMMRVFYTTCDGRYKNKTIGFIFYSNVNHCPLLSIAAIGTSPFFIASPRLALPIWSWTHFTAAYMFFVSSWLTPARFSDIAAKV